MDIYTTSDYWATPYEFLARDKGDCEDYVIAKYFALLHLGIKKNNSILPMFAWMDMTMPIWF